MAQPPDNWPKRTHSQHLTPTEINLIRQAYQAGRPARDVARELQCSTRAVHKHYAWNRGDPPPARRKPRPSPKKLVPEEKPRAPAHRNLYRSNFEPT